MKAAERQTKKFPKPTKREFFAKERKSLIGNSLENTFFGRGKGIFPFHLAKEEVSHNRHRRDPFTQSTPSFHGMHLHIPTLIYMISARMRRKRRREGTEDRGATKIDGLVFWLQRGGIYMYIVCINVYIYSHANPQQIKVAKNELQ